MSRGLLRSFDYWWNGCRIQAHLNKEEKHDADYWLAPSASKYDVSLTIKDHLLIPMAGVDESNGNGTYILWPRAPPPAGGQ